MTRPKQKQALRSRRASPLTDDQCDLLGVPSVADIKLVTDLDEFNKRVNAALSWFLGKQKHHEIVASFMLHLHECAVRDGGQRLVPMMNEIIMRHADHADQRRGLETRMRSAGVLTEPMRKRVNRARTAMKEASRDTSAEKRSDEDEGRAIFGAIDEVRRLRDLGLIVFPETATQ